MLRLRNNPRSATAGLAPFNLASRPSAKAVKTSGWM
jgi:hypothetical protein